MWTEKHNFLYIYLANVNTLLLILIAWVGGLGYTIELEANLQKLYHVLQLQPTYQRMTLLLLYVQSLRHVLYDEVHKNSPQKLFSSNSCDMCMAFDAFIYTHLYLLLLPNVGQEI